MSLFALWVPGVSKTKGSMEAQQPRGRGRAPRLVQSVEGSERWASLVEQAVWQWVVQQGWAPLAGPVAVRLAFWLPVDPIAYQAGDLDKLERNVLDALKKAKVYGDDVQVVRMMSDKYGPAASPGALIQAWPHVPDRADATVELLRRQLAISQGLTV